MVEFNLRPDGCEKRGPCNQGDQGGLFCDGFAVALVRLESRLQARKPSPAEIDFVGCAG